MVAEQLVRDRPVVDSVVPNQPTVTTQPIYPSTWQPSSFFMPSNAPIREPSQIRDACVRKLRAVKVSDKFQAILGCILGVDWTTPRLVELVITPDGHLLGRCDGQTTFEAFLGCQFALKQYQ